MSQKLEILFSAEAIRKRVEALGRQIAQDYRDDPPVALCVLKGAWMFFADLVRTIDLPVECEFLSVSSYGSGTVTSGVVKLRSPLPERIAGRRVLIVEDIADSGHTLHRLQQWLKEQGAREVRVCVLLDKPERRQVPVKLDYVGFTIPDRFVVGYGIDYAEQYRNLPYIAALDEDG